MFLLRPHNSDIVVHGIAEYDSGLRMTLSEVRLPVLINVFVIILLNYFLMMVILLFLFCFRQ